MIKNKKITIDKEDYELTQLGAVEGSRLWLRLAKTVAGGAKTLVEHDKLNEKAMTAALAAIVAELDEATFEALRDAFMRRTRVRVGNAWPELSESGLFDMHFAGRFLSMSKWMYESIVFNFASFLTDSSLEGLTGLVRAGTSKLTSPMTSTGSSGES